MESSAQRRLEQVSATLAARHANLASLVVHTIMYLEGRLTGERVWFKERLESNEVNFNCFRYNTTSGIKAIKFFGRDDLLQQGIITDVRSSQSAQISAIQVAKRIMAKLMAEDQPDLFQEILDLDLKPELEEQNLNIFKLNSLWEDQPDMKPGSGRKRTPQCFGQFQWHRSSTTALQFEAIAKMWTGIMIVSQQLVDNKAANGPMAARPASKLLQNAHNIGELLGFVTALDLSITGLVSPPTKAELVDLYCERFLKDNTHQHARIKWNSTILIVAQLSGLKATNDINKIDGTNVEIQEKIERAVDSVRRIIADAMGRRSDQIGWDIVEHTICKTGRWNREKGGTPKFYKALVEEDDVEDGEVEEGEVEEGEVEDGEVEQRRD